MERVKLLLLKAENISVELNGHILFENAAIEIREGQRIALIGKNGIGKTTFIKCLLGQLPITKGYINKHVNKEEIGWMEQDAKDQLPVTVRAFIELEEPHLYELKRTLSSMEQKLQLKTDIRLAEQYTLKLQQYIELNGYEWEAKVERQLQQVGLPNEIWGLPYQHVSGGQKTRAKLARVMTKNPKLLVLDEPTNHLDMETMDWLAKWLKTFRGTILFISHERALIDEVAEITYEFTKDGLNKYAGGYKQYVKQKELALQTQLSQYQKQEQERKKLKEAIMQYRQWFQRSHHAAGERNPFAKKKANKHITRLKAKEKALERLEHNSIEKPKEEEKINVNLESERFSSRKMLSVSQMSFAYRNHEALFNNVSFNIQRGDRIAVVGNNGSGKTTLLKLIAGELQATKGEIISHPALKIGYFRQELEDLDQEKTVLEQIMAASSMPQSEVRTILACFLFKRQDVFKKIKELSMGEKCRVAFVKLYFSEANLLVLDEPTNYLDIETRERIEEALCLYPGAAIIVSHDPYLLSKVSNRVISIKNRELSDYIGSYKEWKNYQHISNSLQQVENERSRLSLKLTQLLTEEMPDQQQEKTAYLSQIKILKDQLAQLDKIQDE